MFQRNQNSDAPRMVLEKALVRLGTFFNLIFVLERCLGPGLCLAQQKNPINSNNQGTSPMIDGIIVPLTLQKPVP
jgi:hypothetical protein